jgi:hypothetical protein
MPPIVCRPRSLPPERLAAAARRAVEINPANSVQHRGVVRTPSGRRGGPRRLAVLIGRRWPASGVRLSVKFMDNPAKELRTRILLHMNAWGKTANVVFTETRGAGQVRIARLDSPADMAGYWSWVGTEILEVPKEEPTFNLEGFTMRTPESEFLRVVRHEAGHTLGFEHEHMRAALVNRIDRAKAIAFFDRDQGWTPQEVEEQVLTPLAAKSIMGTVESDPLSIMCYQIPGEITKNGKPIVGGVDINAKDYAFAASIYPKQVAPKRRR